jgi:hypothetical protein
MVLPVFFADVPSDVVVDIVATSIDGLRMTRPALKDELGSVTVTMCRVGRYTAGSSV